MNKMQCFLTLILIAATASASPVNKNPPQVKKDYDFAGVGRYIVGKSNWATLGSISNQTGYPKGHIFGISDAGTGIPYTYVTLLDPMIRSLQNDPRSFMTMTLAQSDFCSNKKLDVANPACPQVTLVGDFELVKEKTEEYDKAQKSLFASHPEMAGWPNDDHKFVVAKLKVKSVRVTSRPQGPHSGTPTVEEYLAAEATEPKFKA